MDIPGLELSHTPQQWKNKWVGSAGFSKEIGRNFGCISLSENLDEKAFKGFNPSATQLLKHPLAMIALVPRDAALFTAAAIAGAAAKSVTAPLDRIKLLMQVPFLKPFL